MSATMNQYRELLGNVKESIVMARCACVACNSCTCACSCRFSPNSDFDWENL